MSKGKLKAGVSNSHSWLGSASPLWLSLNPNTAALWLGLLLHPQDSQNLSPPRLCLHNHRRGERLTFHHHCHLGRK